MGGVLKRGVQLEAWSYKKTFGSMGIEMVMHVVQRVSFWWKTMFLCREGGGRICSKQNLGGPTGKPVG